MSRVLVTGASGFVGTPALDALAAAGHEVHAVSSRGPGAHAATVWHVADLLAPDAAERLIGEVAPDRLLHLAWYAEPGRYWTSPENVRWVEATLGLLRAFARSGGRRAVMAGTCAEYEWGGDEPLREDATPLRPATLYGTAKHATQLLAAALADQLEFELAWGRVFFLYGPGESPERLVASLIRGLLSGERVPTTEGSLVRDFMHVSDVAGAFVALLDSDLRGAVNIGSGHGVAVREVVAEIGAATGRADAIDVGALEPRPDEPARIVADATRLWRDLGFNPRFELAEGIRDTVRWWRERLATGTQAAR
jgi:nucleoside-diphosphate-sugar epimerase